VYFYYLMKCLDLAFKRINLLTIEYCIQCIIVDIYNSFDNISSISDL